MKKKEKNKIIVPIIITVIFVIYFMFYFTAIISVTSGAMKYLLGILPLIFMVVMIMVCVERIKEIKRGEDDDISKY